MYLYGYLFLDITSDGSFDFPYCLKHWMIIIHKYAAHNYSADNFIPLHHILQVTCHFITGMSETKNQMTCDHNIFIDGQKVKMCLFFITRLPYETK